MTAVATRQPGVHRRPTITSRFIDWGKRTTAGPVRPLTARQLAGVTARWTAMQLAGLVTGVGAIALHSVLVAGTGAVLWAAFFAVGWSM